MKYLFLLLLIVSFSSLAEEKKKTVKETINETADQVDQGVRKAIKEVKTFANPPPQDKKKKK